MLTVLPLFSTREPRRLVADESPALTSIPNQRIVKNQSLNVQSEISQKMKKSGPITFEDCLKIYRKMF